MNILALHNYCSQLPGATSDYHNYWQMRRYHIGGRLFAMLDTQNATITIKCAALRASALRASYPQTIVADTLINKNNWLVLYYQDLQNTALLEALICHAYDVVFSKLSPKSQLRIIASDALLK